MSAAFLLDVNVLLALLWPDNPRHSATQRWFRENHKKGWATCAATQASFVRLSSNSAFTVNALTPSGAISLLQKNMQHPNHEFWSESFPPTDLLEPFQGRIVGHRQITDACLLGLVIKKQGRLVTFDQRISTLLPPEERKSKWIVELPGSVH